MMDADETYWRLSFVDPSAPAGHRWLGGTLVTGRDIEQAVENAWRLGVNPGGAVLGGPVLADDVPGLIRHYGRLVTDEDEWTSSDEPIALPQVRAE